MELFEIQEAKLELIEEAKKKKKRKLFKSPIMKSDFLNRNGRIYPKNVVKKMVSKAKEQIEGNKLYGSSFHPKDGFGDAHNVAWIMRNLEMVEDEVIVTGEILETSKGKDLQVILQAGGSLGLSIRGFGDSRDIKHKQQNGEEVECKEITSFQLTGCDVVLNPSFNTQFSKANMFESVGLIEREDESGDVIVAEREDMKKSFRKIFEKQKDAGEIELEEEFSDWLANAGLSDEQIDEEIRKDRESKNSSDIYNFEQAIISGFLGNFEDFKKTQCPSQEEDLRLIQLFEEAKEAGFKGTMKEYVEAVEK